MINHNVVLSLFVAVLGVAAYPWALRAACVVLPQLRGMVPATLSAARREAFTLADLPDLRGRVAVITGGNVGLGYWTARHAVGHDATVVIGCRSEVKCAAAAAEIRVAVGSQRDRSRIVPMALDLASSKSIFAFAKALQHAGYERVDALVLNAGVMRPPFALTEDGLELQIGVNHFGHALLARELEPLLVAAAQRRGAASVVVVSSSAHYRPYAEGVRRSVELLSDPATYDAWRAYGQSKLANVLFARALAKRLAPQNVRVNACHPGFVATALLRHVEAPFVSRAGALAALVERAMHAAERAFAWAPRDAALTQLFLAFDDGILGAGATAGGGAGGGVTGRYFHPVAAEQRPSALARSDELEAAVWAMTERWIAKMRRAHRGEDHFK
jgi:NAD(P)-dependent dehydrogenase (short-subunit alcohol dehydrogenase family)